MILIPNKLYWWKFRQRNSRTRSIIKGISTTEFVFNDKSRAMDVLLINNDDLIKPITLIEEIFYEIN
jgi:hypothetical protein